MAERADLNAQAQIAVKKELCSSEEADDFVQAELARQQAIQVDDFAP